MPAAIACGYCTEFLVRIATMSSLPSCTMQKLYGNQVQPRMGVSSRCTNSYNITLHLVLNETEEAIILTDQSRCFMLCQSDLLPRLYSKGNLD